MVTGPRKGEIEILAWLVGRAAVSANVLVICGSVVFFHTPYSEGGVEGIRAG